jgi:glycosyltransferase involved in cell wall biosynthesis
MEKPRRILMLNYEFPPLGGGAATATLNLLKQLSGRKELEIDLITSSVGEYRKEKFSENINIYFLDIGKKGRIHDQSEKDLLIYTWKAFCLARKLKKENSYSLVHAFFGIPCGFIAMFLGRPYIVSLRGSDVPFYSEKYKWLDRLIFWWLSRMIWKKANSVVANSQGLKDLALKTDPKRSIGVIYNGVDTEIFRPVEKNDGNFTVISTSRIIKRKGIDLLLKAFVDLSKDKADVRLILVGDGNMKENLEKTAKQSEAREKITFAGAVEREKMSQYYQKADVFVLPSLNEGMSNSLLEAMASGLAIVATDTGGTKELVNSENGVIIEKSSAGSIKEALDKLYKNKDLLQSMKLASRQKAEKMNWQNMAEGYIKIYQEIK